MDGRTLGNLCFTEDDSDVRLVFETEELGSSLTIPAHSFVLKRTSRVFRTLLESNQFLENRTGVIEFNISGDVCVGLHFVKYLYTKELPNLEMDLYIMLLKMGRLYDVLELPETCEERLSSILEPFSICRLYQAVENVACDCFLERCKNVMLYSAFLIFMHNRHLTLQESTMKLMLESDTLNIINEEQALSALWQWGLVRCIQENRPGNSSTAGAIATLLPYIRWGLIRNDSDSPWFVVALQQKRTSQDSRERQQNCLGDCRNPVLNLNSFARELKFHLNDSSPMIFRKEGRYELLFFTASCDIILIGFTFIIGLKSHHYWKESITFLVNKMPVNDLFSFKAVPCRYYQLDQPAANQFYSYSIEVEFVKPILIERSRFNVIDMCIAEKRTVAFPQFLLKSNTLSLASNDLNISVQKRVSALISLFYFVKV